MSEKGFRRTDMPGKPLATQEDFNHIKGSASVHAFGTPLETRKWSQIDMLPGDVKDTSPLRGSAYNGQTLGKHDLLNSFIDSQNECTPNNNQLVQEHPSNDQ
jgi:hypothetical protein